MNDKWFSLCSLCAYNLDISNSNRYTKKDFINDLKALCDNSENNIASFDSNLINIALNSLTR